MLLHHLNKHQMILNWKDSKVTLKKNTTEKAPLVECDDGLGSSSLQQPQLFPCALSLWDTGPQDYSWECNRENSLAAQPSSMHKVKLENFESCGSPKVTIATTEPMSNSGIAYIDSAPHTKSPTEEDMLPSLCKTPFPLAFTVQHTIFGFQLKITRHTRKKKKKKAIPSQETEQSAEPDLGMTRCWNCQTGHLR